MTLIAFVLICKVCLMAELPTLLVCSKKNWVCVSKSSGQSLACWCILAPLGWFKASLNYVVSLRVA